MKSTDYYRARRDAWFKGKCCAECGSTESLQIDHRDPTTKDRAVSKNIWLVSEERRQAELAKCQVLCRPCHRKKTGREVSEKYRTGEMVSPFVRDPALARRAGSKGGTVAAPNNRFVQDPAYASQCGKLGGRPKIANEG